MTEVISAPGDLIVATSDGVDVRFAGLELTADIPGHVQVQPGERAVKINLEAIRCFETDQRDHIYNEAMLEWVERRKSQGDESAGPVPVMPGVLAFEPVDVQVTDDCGTEYRFVSGQAAGNGAEWSAFRAYPDKLTS